MKVNFHLCKNKNPLSIPSHIIKWFQNTNYSHYVLEIEGIGIVHATGDGVVLTTLDNFKTHYVSTKVYYCNIDFEAKDILNFLCEYDNVKYGFVQLFGFVLTRLGLYKSNPFGNNERRIICSELVVLFLKKFVKSDIGDTDNYDLNATEKLLQEICYVGKSS